MLAYSWGKGMVSKTVGRKWTNKIQDSCFLGWKGFGVQKAAPLHEELYETSMRSSKIPRSIRHA
jgi:hypothetical protein